MNAAGLKTSSRYKVSSKHSLADAGYQVDAAADGKTALCLAAEGKYDVLIVDLGLPDQDGIGLILQLRQLGVSAPVLILSARRSVDDRVRGLEQGGDDYLTKPFALAELLARLRNLLKRNSPSSEVTRLRVPILNWICCGVRHRAKESCCI